MSKFSFHNLFVKKKVKTEEGYKIEHTISDKDLCDLKAEVYRLKIKVKKSFTKAEVDNIKKAHKIKYDEATFLLNKNKEEKAYFKRMIDKSVTYIDQIIMANSIV